MFSFNVQNIANARVRLFDVTRIFHPLNCQILLYGEANATVDENMIFFRSLPYKIIILRKHVSLYMFHSDHQQTYNVKTF